MSLENPSREVVTVRSGEEEINQVTSERRSVPRREVNYTVFFYYALPESPTTKMLDLSAGGAAVEAFDALPIGSETSFVFVMNRSNAIECRARVISVQPHSDCKYRIGVRFTGLSDAARQLVAQATQEAERML